ncbi:MAG: ABC transporter ATP-binding protein [Planctomycetota bacterium]|nr:ABC transporter ATP-binding protein [Planctomycetota bacterium]
MTTSTAPPSGGTDGVIAPREGTIVVRGLGHRFGDKVALEDGLELAVEAGGVVGLLGPNGSGKSTLMRLLVGLVPLERGAVTVDGVPLEKDGLGVRRRVTYAPGELHLYGELTGGEHLSMLLRARTAEALRRARETAEELGLPLDRMVRGYSHGMKRQLVFAAAMAPAVRVRILDEISEGLDPAKRSQILDHIERDAASGTTILLSSHHLGEVDRACQRIIFLSAGRIIADETAAAVRARAARVLKLRFPEGADGEAIAAALRGADVAALSQEEGVFRLVLQEEDPRPFLGRLAAAKGLPAPLSVEHGRLSLRELYRSLYGVEGT